MDITHSPELPTKNIPIVIELDARRSGAWIWRWRNLWRRMLPPGLIVFPFQSYPTLIYFWNAGPGSSVRWISLCGLLTAFLVAFSIWTFAIAAQGNAAPWESHRLADLRLAVLPLYMLLTALAVVARCRWWKCSHSLDEFLITHLEGRDILPLLWVPAVVAAQSIYGAGFVAHLLFAGQWDVLFQEGLAVWYQLAAPGNLLLAIFEFLLALLLMRAAAICSLFGCVKSASMAGITSRALISAVQYILLAVAGSFIQLLILSGIVVVSLALGASSLRWLAVVMASLGMMSLLRHLTIDSLEDYEDFLREWRQWIV